MAEGKEQDITQVLSQLVVYYVEEIKEILSSEVWESIFLNCTKNEILVFWLLYREGEVNMTELADYIHVPLNTASGIVSRMEKSGLLVRMRSKEDKRVVYVTFSERGRAQFEALIGELYNYGIQVASAFSQEEIGLFCRMTAKVIEVLRQENKRDRPSKKVRKIVIE